MLIIKNYFFFFGSTFFKFLFSNFVFNKINSEFNFSCLSTNASKSSRFTIPWELINFSNLLFITLSISVLRSAKVDNAPVIIEAVSFKKKISIFH